MRFHHRINLNLLNQPQIIGTYRIELIDQVIRLLVRCRITQTTQRIQIRQSRATRLGLKILRLIDNHNRVRRLNELNRRNPLLTHLIDHHAVTGERINIHHQNLNRIAARKMTQYIQLLRVIHMELRGHSIQLIKMLRGDLQVLQHALTNRHTRHSNHKFSEAIQTVQLKNRAQIHIRFARTRFHLNRQVRKRSRHRLPSSQR